MAKYVVNKGRGTAQVEREVEAEKCLYHDDFVHFVNGDQRVLSVAKQYVFTIDRTDA